MVFIDSTSNLNERNRRCFILIIHSACGALLLGKYFTESKISETVIINATTILECFRS